VSDKQEVYESTTHGPIPLSFTGRRLMANLRQAVETELQNRQVMLDGSISPYNWEPIARARGELAKYISEVERNEASRINNRVTIARLAEENEHLRKLQNELIASKDGLLSQIHDLKATAHAYDQLEKEYKKLLISLDKDAVKAYHDFSNSISLPPIPKGYEMYVSIQFSKAQNEPTKP
jgi:hypothetical protein